MSDRPAPACPPASPLADLLAALRAVMADERRAVARLDLAAIESAAARKQALAEELLRLHGTLAAPTADEARAITAARVELAASMSLLGTAAAAVSAVLGHEPDGGRYDRLARRHSPTGSVRVVAY